MDGIGTLTMDRDDRYVGSTRALTRFREEYPDDRVLFCRQALMYEKDGPELVRVPADPDQRRGVLILSQSRVRFVSAYRSTFWMINIFTLVSVILMALGGIAAGIVWSFVENNASLLFIAIPALVPLVVVPVLVKVLKQVSPYELTLDRRDIGDIEEYLLGSDQAFAVRSGISPRAIRFRDKGRWVHFLTRRRMEG